MAWVRFTRWKLVAGETPGQRGLLVHKLQQEVQGLCGQQYRYS
jgi:hypothetical protein